MWLSKVNVYCKYNVEMEIVVVKKKGNLYSQVPKRKKMVMNEMKMLEPKKKFFHQDLEYKESIWDKFGGMFDFFEEIFVHEWI